MCFLVLGSGNYFSAIVSQEVSYIFSTTLTQNFGPQQQDEFLSPQQDPDKVGKMGLVGVHHLCL